MRVEVDCLESTHVLYAGIQDRRSIGSQDPSRPKLFIFIGWLFLNTMSGTCIYFDSETAAGQCYYERLINALDRSEIGTAAPTK
ncbi:hypothetical protein Bca52824_027937 [Brassica carinata]|uniref:Uncharacterized protein n=1 Tax=Brassica carinata TaxID=52824 RepID=A0A8X7VBD2_BRACI|nr:hypothetical protein Bca52824_027937 [Brassica carinata]